MKRRRLNEQHRGRQRRVDELLEKGVARLSEAERQELRELYAGDGDWSGAFYTPPVVARFAVEMGLASLDRAPARAIDPWCGIAPFFEYLPAATRATGIELLQQEADIAQLLYPEACIAG